VSYRPDPDAFLIDAFTTNWADYKGCIFHFSLIGRVLRKL